MKTGEEKHDLAVNYVEETFPTKVEGTFEKHQMANAFCRGFAAGYEDCQNDCQDYNALGGMMAKFKKVEKLAEKADLHLAGELNFTSNRADVTLYEYKNNRMGDRVFSANPNYKSGTMGRMGEFLLMAEEFIYKYTADSEENLEKKLASLRAELTATRKSLIKARKIRQRKEAK